MSKVELSLEMYDDLKEKESALESILKNESVIIEVVSGIWNDPIKYKYIKRDDFLNKVLKQNEDIKEQVKSFKEENLKRFEEEISFRKELMNVLGIPKQWDIRNIKDENFLEIAKSKKDKSGILNRLKKWFEGI